MSVRTRGEDPNRELRAMVLLTLPYPPLPILATRFDADDHRLQDDEVITSHTLIAQGLEDSMARNCHAGNMERQKRQQTVMQSFLHAMATEGFLCDADRLYLLYCRFTLEHIATYFPVGHPLDIRFHPISYATKGDKIHAKMAEYMAGQSLFFEDPSPILRETYLRYDYREMLLAARDRIGHVMTEEERARLHHADE
jgi:hypothetical protein